MRVLGMFMVALLFVYEASAGRKAPTTTGVCAIRGELELTSIHVVWGGMGGEGPGAISCDFSDGAHIQKPLFFKVWGVGIGIGATKTVAKLAANRVRISGRDASKLLGDYAMARASQEIGHDGHSVILDFTATRNSIAIPFSVKVEEGDGVELAANIGGISLERGH